MRTENMTVSKWYGLSIPIPGYTSPLFGPFMSSSLGIVRSVVADNLGKDISIRFVDIETAAADQERRLILLTQGLLSGRIGGEFHTNPDTAIGIALGLIVHESAHFAWSPRDLLPFADYVKERTKHKMVFGLATTLGNMVEDIYIEAEIDRVIPSLTWTLDISNRCFFTEEDIKARVAAVKHITEPAKTAEQLEAIANIIILAKIRSDLEFNPYISGIYHRALDARELSELEDRFALTLELYDELMQDIEFSDLDMGDIDASEGHDGGSAKPDEMVEDSDEADGVAGGVPSEPGVGRIEEVAREVGKKASGFLSDEDVDETTGAGSISTQAQRINSELRNREESKVVVGDKGEYSLSDDLLVIEHVIPNTGGRLPEMDERYQALGELARQRATANRPYGESRKRGNHIRRLHRIATDQKIFAEPLSMQSYKPMQVIILIDASGSMRRYVDDGKYYSTTSMIEAAAKATMGAAYGLANGRCEVGVYAHTAHLTGSAEMTIFRLKEMQESLDVLSPRLKQLPLEPMRENMDGMAVRYVSKKFTAARGQKRRLLIVISDGAPACPGYTGMKAMIHSWEMVDQVREEGIEVLSISIDRSANESNDYIYGKSWNVCNTDPNVLDQVVRSLVLE